MLSALVTVSLSGLVCNTRVVSPNDALPSTPQDKWVWLTWLWRGSDREDRSSGHIGWVWQPITGQRSTPAPAAETWKKIYFITAIFIPPSSFCFPAGENPEEPNLLEGMFIRGAVIKTVVFMGLWEFFWTLKVQKNTSRCDWQTFWESGPQVEKIGEPL